MTFMVFASVHPSLSFRLGPIPSTSMRSTVYPPRAPSPPIRLLMQLTPILLLRPHRRTMNLHLNASSAFPRRVRLFFCPVAIWSRAASAPSTWSSLVLEVPLPTLKRSLLRLARTGIMQITRKHLRLKKKVQEPQLKLRPPIEGRGGPKGGSVLYADNVRSTILSWSIADILSVSLRLPPQDHDDSATEGRNRH